MTVKKTPLIPIIRDLEKELWVEKEGSSNNHVPVITKNNGEYVLDNVDLDELNNENKITQCSLYQSADDVIILPVGAYYKVNPSDSGKEDCDVLCSVAFKNNWQFATFRFDVYYKSYTDENSNPQTVNVGIEVFTNTQTYQETHTVNIPYTNSIGVFSINYEGLEKISGSIIYVGLRLSQNITDGIGFNVYQIECEHNAIA